MPLYEYRCDACEHQFEVIQSFSAKPIRKCEKCGGRVQKLISRAGFVLKGGGWYKSDYAPSKAPSESSEKDGSRTSDKAGSEASSSDSPAPAPAAKSDKPDKPGASSEIAPAARGKKAKAAKP